MEERTRCSWAGDTPIYVDYHDNEWGRPTHDDRELFELLVLEGAQAGLSWLTILKKREAYREAFDGFDPAKVARYDEAKVIWGYVDGEPIVNHWKTQADVPATTPLSDRISKDLKKRGFKFVGSTIVYAYMQSIGMVNDHVADCFVRREMVGKSSDGGIS